MARRSFDLIAVMIIAALAAGVTLAGVSPVPVRVLFAIPLVLILPGYAVVAAALPEAQTPFISAPPERLSLNPLGGPERFLLSLGVSLALAACGGLLLNVSPWGLQADSWAVLLAGVSVSGAVLGLLRRKYRIAGPSRPDVALSLRQGILFGLAALVAGGAVALATVRAAQVKTPGFSQLWIVPGQVGSPYWVRLGVTNMEGTLRTYTLRLEVGREVVRRWTSITLRSGQGWKTRVTFTTAPTRPIEGVLYRADRPATIYRSVLLRPNTFTSIRSRTR